MKNIKVVILSLVALIIVALLAFTFSNSQNNEPVDVMTSIHPVYALTSELTTGTDITVGLILPAGASPHTFEPSPSKTQNILDSKKIFYIGEGLDNWALPESNSQKAVKLSSNINLLETEHTDHEEEHEDDHANENHEEDHEHGPIDPHYWLSPKNAILIADTIAKELIAAFPESAEQIRNNRQVLGNDLGALDQQITEILAEIENRNIITLHEAWYYFANDYDLNIAATFEPVAGREPTAKYLEELIEELKEYNLTTIYSEAQLNIAPLKSFAADNGLTIAELDPLGGTEGRESYFDLMIYNANTIANNQ